MLYKLGIIKNIKNTIVTYNKNSTLKQKTFSPEG